MHQRAETAVQQAAMEAILAAQKTAYGKEMCPPWQLRRDRLQRLRTLVKQHQSEIAEAISADFSYRPQEETRLLEVFPSLAGISHALSHGRSWMKPRRRRTGFWFLPARSRLFPQPLGVAGIMVPWNYPLFLAIGPLTAALAAGNRAMIKMPELTPAFSALFERLIARYFAPEEVAVINGDAAIAQGFSQLPFDHLLFTGSIKVGHDVMRAASTHLTPVTLELGGKSPVLICPSDGSEAALRKAAEAILRGKCVNAGQTCIAPDYVLLPEAQRDAFIRIAAEVFSSLYPAERAGKDYAAIVSERHYQRLQHLVQDAVDQGAQAHQLGQGAMQYSPRQMAPVLLTGVQDQMTVMQEEIFGPVLPVETYRSLPEAIARINQRPRPLALYAFGRNTSEINTVLNNTISGGVTVNDTLLHIAQDDLPFGGVGPSGMGAYHAREGFDTFSKLKPVLYQSRLNLTWLAQAPYTARFEWLLKWMLR